MPLLVFALFLAAHDSKPVGIARMRLDAQALAPQVTTGLARDFLKAVSSLRAIQPRTLYHDPVKKTYVTEQAAGKLGAQDRDRLKKLSVDETFYYNTRYGSPLAYARPLELVGKSGLDGVSGRKVLDFGCGGIGPLRMMATLGADVVGVDVDPMLAALYSKPEDLGAVKDGRVSMIIGRYPADEAIKAKVGGGYDLILSKNTLKRGYLHPESGRAFIDLGMTDVEMLKTLHAALKPGGRVMVYNLGAAPNPPGEPYKAMADIRTPFSRADWVAAGFHVDAYDQDDSPAARRMAAALGWDQGPNAIDLKKDLFATFTLMRRP